MKKLTEIKTIRSLEIADMLGVRHGEILRKLDGNNSRKGYIEILNEHQMASVDYFIKSIYRDNKGEERPCYLFTKLGCDFIANKFTGERGVLFTAKYVKRFDEMENYIKGQKQLTVPFSEVVQSIDIVANSLKVNDASKMLMYDKLYQSYGIETEFLPKYENNGSREMRPATELLKRIGADMKTVKFNQLLIQNGYLEERSRKSTKSDELRYFKAIAEKGLKYGENLVNEKNQREVQPYYYADMFEELYNLVALEVGVAV